MKKFLSSNIFYGILSVVLAVFLMFFVDSAENPVQEKSFVAVNIAVINLTENYLLESEPGMVEIRVRGLKSALNLTSSRDVLAWVDLQGSEPGQAPHDIQVSLPSGLELVSLRPVSVELDVDRLDAKNVPVYSQTINAVREGYSHLEPQLRPAEITVSGPRRTLDRVEAARVMVDLSDKAAEYQEDLPVILLDSDNKEIQDARLSLSAATVRAQVAVTENLLSKSMQVRTALSGTADEKYIVTGMEVEPSVVKVSGPYAVISRLGDYLTTAPIELSALTETFQEKVELALPENVAVLEGNQVLVTIGIEENLTRRTFAGIPVELRDPPPGKSYGCLPGVVDVTLAAYPWVFANASNEAGEYNVEVKAYVDLAGELADSRDYPVRLDYPEEYRVTEISPGTVRLYSN
jgi:YbbR domain-containing protein